MELWNLSFPDLNLLNQFHCGSNLYGTRLLPVTKHRMMWVIPMVPFGSIKFYKLRYICEKEERESKKVRNKKRGLNVEPNGTMEPLLPPSFPRFDFVYVPRNLSYSNESECRIHAELQARLERMELQNYGSQDL